MLGERNRTVAYCSKCNTPIPLRARFCPTCGTPVEVPSSPYSPGPQTPASDTGLSALARDSAAQEYWLRRLVAYVIDALIVYVAIGVIVAATVLPAFLMGIFVPGSSPRVAFFGGFFGTFSSLILVLYFTLAEASYGRTVGKSVMGFKVVKEGGGRPSLGTSLLRNLSKINWVLLLLDVVLGLALEVGYMRKFSDRYLGTSVARA